MSTLLKTVVAEMSKRKWLMECTSWFSSLLNFYLSIGGGGHYVEQKIFGVPQGICVGQSSYSDQVVS